MTQNRGIQSIRHGVFKDFLGRGVFTMDGAFWQHSRAMLRPQFEKSQVSAIDQFEPHVLKLLSCIPTDGSTIDLQDLFHKLSMDTSTEFLTGNGTDCLGGDKDADKFQQAFEKAMHEGLRQSLLGVFYYLYPRSRKEAVEAIKYAHKAVDGWVKQAMQVKNSSSSGLSEKAKDRGERYVFLNELARHEEVDAVRIRDETLNILLAGRDTTAALLSNLWFNLARSPKVYGKLKAEVDALNGEQPSYETLRNMKYIKYAVQESKFLSRQKPQNPITKNTPQNLSFNHPPHPSPSLTTLPTSSPPHVPSRSLPEQTRHNRHPAPPRRRARRPTTALHPPWNKDKLQHTLAHASNLPLRRRRRHIQPLSLGRSLPSARLELPSLRRRRTGLFGPAVRADGDVLRDHKDGAEVWGAWGWDCESGPGGVEGEAGGDLLFGEWGEGCVCEGWWEVKAGGASSKSFGTFLDVGIGLRTCFCFVPTDDDAGSSVMNWFCWTNQPTMKKWWNLLHSVMFFFYSCIRKNLRREPIFAMIIAFSMRVETFKGRILVP